MLSISSNIWLKRWGSQYGCSPKSYRSPIAQRPRSTLHEQSAEIPAANDIVSLSVGDRSPERSVGSALCAIRQEYGRRYQTWLLSLRTPCSLRGACPESSKKALALSSRRGYMGEGGNLRLRPLFTQTKLKYIDKTFNGLAFHGKLKWSNN